MSVKSTRTALFLSNYYVIKEKIPDFISCRRILSIMLIAGFMIHHMIRINISIAIVDMIAKNDTNNTEEQTRFNWNEEQKNDILGCYFWGYLLTQIPGGRFSEIFGTRIVLGISMLLASILTLVVPAASFLHFNCLIAARVCLGLSMGVQWPSFPPIANGWVATTDTSKFMSHTIASSLGVAISLPVCGYLIAYLGWPSVFYVTGSITFMWTLAWFYLVYDTPRQHPRISNEEREKLEKRMRTEICFYRKENEKETENREIRDHSNENKPTPWKQILTSRPVWAIILTNTFTTFSFFVVLNQLPSYMYQVLRFNIKESGLYSSMPYILRYFTAVAACYVADKIRKINKFSTVTIRKFFTSVCCLGPSLLFTLQIFTGPNRAISVIVFTLSLGLNGFGTAGFVTNTLDIAPTYCGTVYGLTNAAASLMGYVGTKIVALITKEKQDFEDWVYIFWILVGTNLAGFLVYIFFASGQIQRWDPKMKEVTKVEKLLADDTSKSSV